MANVAFLATTQAYVLRYHMSCGEPPVPGSGTLPAATAKGASSVNNELTDKRSAVNADSSLVRML